MTDASGRGASALASAILTQLMIVLDMTVVAVALPSMQADLAISAQQRPWIVTAYALAFGGLVLFGGRIQTVIGLSAAYRAGLTGFALASLAAGLSPDFGILVTARAAQGACAALLAPTVLALVNRTFTEPARRARAFALLGSTSGLGAAVGLLVGGLLTDLLDWRWTMFINAPIAAIAVIVSIGGLPPRGRRRTAASLLNDLVGLLLGCGAIFLLVYGFDRAQRRGWSAPATLVSLAASGLIAVAFLIREHRAGDPVLPLAMVRDAARAGSYLVMFTSACAQMGCAVYLTYYFQDCFGYSPLKTGAVFLPMVAALTLTAVVAGRTLVPRLGARVCFPAGLAFQAAGTAILSRMTAGSTYAQVALPGLLVVGMGLGLALPVVFNAGTRGVAEERTGLASAVISTCQQVGSSFGVALLSTLATRRIDSYLAGHAGRLQSEAARELAKARTTADSADGRRIIADLTRDLSNRAQIDAYGHGFTVLTVLIASIALMLAAAALLRSMRRRAAGGAVPSSDRTG